MKLKEVLPTLEDLLEALREQDITVCRSGIVRMFEGPPIDSPGIWNYAQWASMAAPRGTFGFLPPESFRLFQNETKFFQTAYHGTSLKALRWITIDGRLVDSMNITENSPGQYCEGEHRKHLAVAYSTMNRRHNSELDPCLYSAVIKLAVCRNREPGIGQVHKQWREQTGTSYIQGVWFHVLPISRIFQTGHFDKFSIMPRVFQELEHFRARGHEPPQPDADLV